MIVVDPNSSRLGRNLHPPFCLTHVRMKHDSSRLVIEDGSERRACWDDAPRGGTVGRWEAQGIDGASGLRAAGVEDSSGDVAPAAAETEDRAAVRIAFVLLVKVSAPG